MSGFSKIQPRRACAMLLLSLAMPQSATALNATGGAATPRPTRKPFRALCGTAPLSAVKPQIDGLFARWNNTRSPGYAVGIIRDGRLVFARGYGKANLEYGVPITPRSPFYIASMSKQFTAACAALLVQRGKLRLTDEVRRYIPELPDYGHPLTVGELIYHAGGVREWSSLALFQGQDSRYEQRLDNRDLVRLLTRQKSLNFEPGTQFRYSSGGYTLLTEVIERVSGESLPKFARENLFEPLGMHDTFFDDNYAALLPGRVESYRRVGPHQYERLLKHFNVYGDGGVITTVEDLVKWDQNFYDGRVGGRSFVDQLLTPGRLTSGETLPYTFGLYVGEFRGRRTVEHGGYMIEYTADILRFPDQRLSIIVLGNIVDRHAVDLAYQIAGFFFPAPAEPAARTSQPKDPTLPPTVTLTAEQLRPYVGAYWVGGGNDYRRLVELRGDHLILTGSGERLLPVGPARFLLAGSDGVPRQPLAFLSFEPGGPGGMRLRFEPSRASEAFDADRYDPAPPAGLEDLRPYLGRYWSEELETPYTFAVIDGQFSLRIGTGRPIPLFPKPSDPRVEWNSKDKVWIGFAMIVFQRDSAGKVVGLTIGDPRVTGVSFARVRDGQGS